MQFGILLGEHQAARQEVTAEPADWKPRMRLLTARGVDVNPFGQHQQFQPLTPAPCPSCRLQRVR